MKHIITVSYFILAVALCVACSKSVQRPPVAVWEGEVQGTHVRAEVRTGVTQSHEWPDTLVLTVNSTPYTFVGVYHPEKHFICSPIPATPNGISGAGDVFTVDQGNLYNALFLGDPKFPSGSVLPRVKN